MNKDDDGTVVRNVSDFRIMTNPKKTFLPSEDLQVSFWARKSPGQSEGGTLDKVKVGIFRTDDLLVEKYLAGDMVLTNDWRYFVFSCRLVCW